MAYLDDLIAKRDALVAALGNASTAPDYNIDGQMVSRSQYTTSLLEQIKALNELIGLAGGPQIVDSQGYI